LLLPLGWTVLEPAGFWTMAVLVIVLVPALAASVVETIRKPSEVVLQPHLADVLRATARCLAQAVFTLACLPFEACVSLDAIGRTAVRMLITRRRLLEWTPSNHPSSNGDASLSATLRSMWIGPFLSVAAAAYLFHERPDALGAAAPILLLWLASPLLTWWLNRPL